tara:strand:+ start:429 stop:695 length:267 start_codon:yes stop_codon:yes gene_type:complete
MKSGFKMKGMDFGNSPMKQKQVPLSEHEKKKGTEIGGGSKSEEINDLEMRLGDLRSDLKGGSTGKVNVMGIGKQITKIEAQLKKLRAK